MTLPHEPQLLNALASLNEIGSTINRIKPHASEHIEATLRLIVESAIKVVPGTSAVIYTYDPVKHVFDPSSRVSAGENMPPIPGDEPRDGGMGRHAIWFRHRILSYEAGSPSIHPVKVRAGARAVGCFPLIVAEQAVGTVYVYLHEERHFTELELLLLENFVNQAAMAIYHARQVKRIQRDLARREDEVARLRRAGILISSRSHLKDTLDTILQMALEVTDAKYGNILLVDKTGHELLFAAVAGEHLSRPYITNIPIAAAGVTAWVARHREAVCISDLRDEPWRDIYVTFDHDLEMRSELTVPLISASGRLEGVLNLESPMPGAFSEQDNHLLQGFASQAVVAIQEVRLLDALKEITELVLSQSYEHVLERLVQIAAEQLNASDCSVWLMDGDSLVLKANYGRMDNVDRIPLHHSLIGEAILSQQAVVSHDVRTDPRFHRADIAVRWDWSPALIVPLLGGDPQEALGAVSVFGVASESGRFAESDWDRKVLTIIADYAALAVQNAARQTALQQAHEQRTIAETFAALGDVAANLLHQLNNRIGTIPARVQGIQDKCQPVLEAEPYLATNLSAIEASAREAMGVMRDNLSFLHPIALGPVSIAPCVQEAISQTHLPEDICIEIESLEHLPLVLAGPQSLTLVFANLLENAANAMSGQGTVTIRGMIDHGWVEIEIHDTGPGISSQLHDRIFEFSFSGHASSSKLGFGLWWIRSLMARLGGSISVESDGQHGTSFRLKLPCVEDCVRSEAR